jgi:hypothetical protein
MADVIEPILQRVGASQSATTYVRVDDLADNPDQTAHDVLTEDHRRTLALEHGIHAVYDVVRDAWAFTRGVPEEVLQAHQGEAPAESQSAFGDLPSASDITPPGGEVPEVVEVPEGEKPPIVGAAQVATPPVVESAAVPENQPGPPPEEPPVLGGVP